MNFEDIFAEPHKIKTEKWQFGEHLKNEIPEGGIVLIFCSDYRGGDGIAVEDDFSGVRKELYQLSASNFEIPVCDLGNLISGKTAEDTHYILQEVLTFCHKKSAIPVVIGGSNSISYQLFSALNCFKQSLSYTQISNIISLSAEGDKINDKNFVGKLLSSKNFSLSNYFHLGYQKHLNDQETVNLLQEVDIETVRLAEMMGDTENMEPYFRRAHLVTIDCNAVESFAEEFSVNPQVNGLNRREICAYMKEAGLSENLTSAGIFNYNSTAKSIINRQLLAQMIWYLIDGINIRKTHPKEKKFETFWVIDGARQFAFQRDTFSNLWYFGDGEDEEALIPCSRKEYEDAKQGFLHSRFLK